MALPAYATPQLLVKARAHLMKHDPILRPVIQAAGPCQIRHHTEYYRSLVDSIIGQQLSVKAAAVIKQRFRDIFGGTFPEPEAILHKTPAELRSAGLSTAKARYILDLAGQLQRGEVRFERLDLLSDTQILDMLLAINGVGVWTAHMFLIFCMGRLDVLPVGDLGIRTGLRNLYHLASLPTPDQVMSVAQEYHWHPYSSVASWYIWRSLDNTPTV